MLWSTEGALRINDPVVTEQDPEPGSEAAWLGQRREMAMELEVAIVKCAEVSWVTSDLLKSFSAGAEEKAVQNALVLQCQRSQFTRQGEHRVDVARRQQFSFALLERAQACVALASWAMPVAARVIGDGSMPAIRAPITMAAECGGAAAHDRNAARRCRTATISRSESCCSLA